ncbi:flagellar assembly protein FliW [Gemmatimonas groenlandica]|uniref:Flagellar assembly factor FliW n=1 Tax=Gemmatimonas groenlandica TaxID=2732249 RepID=A0A6M4IUB1_9BACT|nr:flagellar assembly protein FliW [Gemmatimonas groenlandica]QJR36442.1 flagellar assembly protein FliW [Gemmatimonas groenlandica]
MSHAVMDQQDRSTTTYTITSPAVGTIEVSGDAVMHFTEALWGFPERTTYALLPAARQGLWWLLSVDEPQTTFVLADPFVGHTDYGIDLGDSERDALQIVEPTDALALVMVALPMTSSEPVTGNFRAPIVFNISKGLAQQIVNRDEQYSLREPMDLSAYPVAEDGLRLS